MESQIFENQSDDKLMLFDDEEDSTEKNIPSIVKPWKILIVDDDEDVHILTRLILRGFEFNGNRITLMSAFSGKETREIIAQNPDIAVILLDVIMEEEHTGLDLVKHIREELNNRIVRIILRTGQPGGALERKVVSTYEIDDYKTKTEITSDKLLTSITTALRVYKEISTIEKLRKGLMMILNNLGRLFYPASFEQLTQNILQFMKELLLKTLPEEHSSSLSSMIAVSEDCDYRIIAATGNYSEKIGKSVFEMLKGNTGENLKKAIDEGNSVLSGEFVVRFLTMDNRRYIICLDPGIMLRKEEQDLLSIFLNNTEIAMRHYFK